MAFRHIFFLFCFVLSGFTMAGSLWAADVGAPVVAPWSVDNSAAQSRIRQYQSFKALQEEPAGIQTATLDQAGGSLPGSALPQVLDPQVQTAFYSEKSLKVQREEPSALEALYSGRVIDELAQFGYDVFGESEAQDVSAGVPSGAVQDDFVLGEGDELEIVFTGQRSERAVYKINSQGQVVLNDLPPLPAAGRTIAQFRASVEAAAGRLYNTEVYVSLSSVRQIGILVVGHVKHPGRQNLTVFHTVVDALMRAGGVDKTGSLRRIKLVRGGRSTFIDLYSLLLHGATTMDLGLRDGDRLIVPPIGPSVAIAGEVKRPGIYEILPAGYGVKASSERLSLNEMLSLSGGVLAPGQNRFVKMALTDNGQELIEEVSEPYEPQFSDGSILMVSKGEARRAGSVELAGEARRPGLYALDQHKRLSALLSSEDVLGRDIYPLIGVIERWDGAALAHEMIDFPLRSVLSGDFDLALKDGDVVHLLSMAQVEFLAQAPRGGVQLVAMGSRDPDDEEDVIEDDVLAGFLRERSVFLRGAVRRAGAYPVAEGISLESLLAAAGGLALEAQKGNIEVSFADGRAGEGKKRRRIDLRSDDPADVMIGPGDSVRVNQRFEKIADQSVLVMGEVKHPGRYDLMPGDKVSDLLLRAGGLSEQAYPYGAIFSRESERRAEELRFKAQARDMERAIAAALEADDEKVNAAKLAEARALASELRGAQGAGRLTIEADPAILTARPELDLLLEAGDRLYVPKRGLSVRVNGEVLSPAGLQFREGKAPLDYIHEAGGFSFHADKERTFVLYPDGSAQPLQVSAWNYKPVMIPPGSTIVVPRDPKPFDFIQSAKDVSQILSNLAVTAIFLDDLGDN